MHYNFKHIPISNGWYISYDYINYKLINKTISVHSSQLCWAFIDQFFVSGGLSKCVFLYGVYSSGSYSLGSPFSLAGSQHRIQPRHLLHIDLCL